MKFINVRLFGKNYEKKRLQFSNGVSIPFKKRVDSKNLMSRLGRFLIFAFVVSIVFTACAKDDADNGKINLDLPEKMSIKFSKYRNLNQDYYDNLIITFDKYGKRVRVDFPGGSIYITDHIQKTKYIYHPGSWRDEAYNDSHDYLPSIRADRYQNVIAELQKKPNELYAGQSCIVFSDGDPSNYYYFECAIWNGIILYENSPNAQIEASSVTTNVPESAFAKTREVTWIK